MVFVFNIMEKYVVRKKEKILATSILSFSTVFSSLLYGQGSFYLFW